MKNKITFFILVIMGVLLITACQNSQKNLPVEIKKSSDELQVEFSIPEIPEGYVLENNIYLAEGNGIYAIIECNAFDCDKIKKEICNGNGRAVKLRFENSNISMEPLEYAAVQNILGITEVYMGNYDSAFEYFNNTIDFLKEKDIPEKNKVLSILYNNAGTVTLNLSINATNDQRLIKAAELCEEPYLALVIAANLTGRVKILASFKDFEEMVERAAGIVEKEAQIYESPNYVLFSAVKYIATGYMLTGHKESAIEVLDEYIPMIPEVPEYYLTKADLLSFRGYCYDSKGEYDRAINDYSNSILLSGHTVDNNSRHLATTLTRLGVSYGNIEEWESALLCFEEAIPGYKYATAYDKGILYWNTGVACGKLNQFEKEKKFYLKAYINNQMVIEDVGDAVGKDYGIEVEGILNQIYLLEKNYTVSFDKWLAKESKQYKEEEDKYQRNPD